MELGNCTQRGEQKSPYDRLQNMTEFRSLKNYDSEAFLQDLQSVDFESAISSASGDPNQMANTFYDLFLSILDVNAPLKKRKGIQRRAPAPWLSARIRKLMRDRDKYKVLAEKDHQLLPRYEKNYATGSLLSYTNQLRLITRV